MKKIGNLVLILMLSTGCSKENVGEIAAVSWSDDSEKIAFLEKNYEEVSSPFDVQVENIRYRIGITDREDQSREYITGSFNHHNNSLNDLARKEVYYKSQSGYFLVRVGSSGSYSENGNIFTDKFEYNFYDPNGSIIHQISKMKNEYCEEYHHTAIPSIRAMPSPSGMKIAVVETTRECELNINILTYTGIFEPLTTERIQGVGIGGLFWVDENNLLVNACPLGRCSDNWNLVRTGEVHSINQEIFESICLSEAIVSSEINSAWEKIEWDSPQNHPSIIEIDSFNYTELGYFKDSNTRTPDNPEDCININDI